MQNVVEMTPNRPALAEACVVARFNSSQWTARKLDRKATAQVNGINGASGDAGRYNKMLLPKEAIKPIQQIVDKARNYHEQVTLPWGNNGARILPSALYFEYSTKMDGLHSEFNLAVEKFLTKYEVYRDTSQDRLGTLFNANDYPPVQDVRRKYDYRVTIDPIPTGADFRVDIGAEAEGRLRADLEERNSQIENRANQDLFKRLSEAVQHLGSRAQEIEDTINSGKKPRVYDSIVDNLSELVALLPKLNFSRDPELDALAREVEAKVLKPLDHSASSIKTSSTARRNTAASAKEMLNKISAFV